jgi:uncharacterized protein YjbI with pentapeptide repeats
MNSFRRFFLWILYLPSSLIFAWFRIRQQWRTIRFLLLLAVLAGLIWLGYHWEWTGFNYHPAYDNQVSGKYLWDWMELFLVPLVLAVVGFWYSRQQQAYELQIAEEERKKDREIAEAAREKDQEIAQQAREVDRQLAAERFLQEQQFASDQLYESRLQSFIDRMAELLLKESLRSAAVDSEVVQSAVVRAKTTLRTIDPSRKAIVIQFLHDVGLISSKSACSLMLDRADLKDVDLSMAQLAGIYLPAVNFENSKLVITNLDHAYMPFSQFTRTDLSYADIKNSELAHAKFFKSNLRNAKMQGTRLEQTMFVETNLTSADLEGAYLERTIFHKVNFQGANLKNLDFRNCVLIEVDFSQAQLDGAMFKDGQSEEAQEKEDLDF